MKPGWAAVLSLAIVSGCSDDTERPPLLQPSGGTVNPVSCDQLRQASPAPNDAGRFLFDGGMAECVVDGQWCPAAWTTDWCDAGMPYARCVGGAWVLGCEAAPEAGVTDAVSDS